MHLPEVTLRIRSFGGLRSLLGVWMRGSDWEIAEDEPQTLAHLGLDLLDNRIRGTAVRTFVVAVLHECKRCAILPLDVVSVRRDGHAEPSLRPSGSHAATPVRRGHQALEESRPHPGSPRW